MLGWKRIHFLLISTCWIWLAPVRNATQQVLQSCNDTAIAKTCVDKSTNHFATWINKPPYFSSHWLIRAVGVCILQYTFNYNYCVSPSLVSLLVHMIMKANVTALRRKIKWNIWQFKTHTCLKSSVSDILQQPVSSRSWSNHYANNSNSKSSEFVLVTLSHTHCADIYNFDSFNRLATKFLLRNNLGARSSLPSHLKTLCKYRLVTFLQLTHSFSKNTCMWCWHFRVSAACPSKFKGWRAIAFHSLLIKYCSLPQQRSHTKIPANVVVSQALEETITCIDVSEVFQSSLLSSTSLLSRFKQC